MHIRLDKFDIQLLNAVQANNQLTAESLSEVVALSASAITRRLRRLRAEGAIAADVAVLSERLTQHRLLALVQVQLDQHHRAAVERLAVSLIQCAEVQYCAEATGSFDFIVLLTVKSMTDLNRLVDELLAGNRAVKRYETNLLKRAWKASLMVRLDQSDTDL